ncbi:hypothetical protein BG011_001763 [Mortierella polycephala]|uniref:Uncharacterized protein n=1 Tax=Mortierella polycephala TaxID=41804 RepID=A0A9P6TUK9_9FUNG|nr:hypothetical protein BG011_001763 [Mortierella polycephala]
MLNTLPVASPSVGKAPKSIAPSNASQPAIESSDWLPKETYYSSAPHQARVYGKDADNLTKETSIPEEVDSTTITGDRGDPPGLMATTTSSTSSATEELEKRLQGHMELLHGQQKQSFQELKDVWKEQSIQTNERLKEQKQDLQELKNVWKEQQRSYESQIAELKVYLSTLLTTRS